MLFFFKNVERLINSLVSGLLPCGQTLLNHCLGRKEDYIPKRIYQIGKLENAFLI